MLCLATPLFQVNNKRMFCLFPLVLAARYFWLLRPTSSNHARIWHSPLLDTEAKLESGEHVSCMWDTLAPESNVFFWTEVLVLIFLSQSITRFSGKAWMAPRFWLTSHLVIPTACRARSKMWVFFFVLFFGGGGGCFIFNNGDISVKVESANNDNTHKAFLPLALLCS